VGVQGWYAINCINNKRQKSLIITPKGWITSPDWTTSYSWSTSKKKYFFSTHCTEEHWITMQDYNCEWTTEWTTEWNELNYDGLVLHVAIPLTRTMLANRGMKRKIQIIIQTEKIKQAWKREHLRSKRNQNCNFMPKAWSKSFMPKAWSKSMKCCCGNALVEGIRVISVSYWTT